MATQILDQALFESIKNEGIRSPILVDQHSIVIDGLIRIAIAEKLKINWWPFARIVPVRSAAHRESLRLQINAIRREGRLNNKGKRDLAILLMETNPDQSDESIATICGYTTRTVWTLRTSRTKAGKLPEKTQTVGKDGRVQAMSSQKRKSSFIGARHLREAEEIGRLLPTVIDQLPNGHVEARTVKRLANAKERIRTNAIAMKEYKALPADDCLYHCNFQDLVIEDHSVDLVLTDPLWQTDAADGWADLARLSKEKWLKPKGILAIFFGNLGWPLLLRTIFPILGDPQVHLVISQPNSNDQGRMNFVVNKHKNVFLWSAEMIQFDRPVQTVFVSAAKEKDRHDYQQTEDAFSWLVHFLSKPNQLVLDPCCGSGTTGLAAHKEGRRFIGCDRDEVAVAQARVAMERLRAAEIEQAVEPQLIQV